MARSDSLSVEGVVIAELCPVRGDPTQTPALGGFEIVTRVPEKELQKVREADFSEMEADVQGDNNIHSAVVRFYLVELQNGHRLVGHLNPAFAHSQATDIIPAGESPWEEVAPCLHPSHGNEMGDFSRKKMRNELLPGCRVMLSLTPYNLNRGRIVSVSSAPLEGL